MIGAALLIVGVPVALPLIVLTFVAAFFPIVGAFTAGAAAVLVALVANGLPAALVIFAVIVAVQQLEGNVFYPIVVGRKLSLHPVGILLALRRAECSPAWRARSSRCRGRGGRGGARLHARAARGARSSRCA